MIKYCFTIKKFGSVEDVDEISYLPCWHLWHDLDINIEYKYPEFDSKGKLHYHGLIKLPNNYYRKRLQLRGYSTYFKKCYDAKNWLLYCTNSFVNYDKTHKNNIKL